MPSGTRKKAKSKHGDTSDDPKEGEVFLRGKGHAFSKCLKLMSQRGLWEGTEVASVAPSSVLELQARGPLSADILSGSTSRSFLQPADSSNLEALTSG